MPGKDLALIRIKVGDKKLHALKIAEKPAAKGQAVYAGVPLGLTGVFPAELWPMSLRGKRSTIS